MFAAFFTSVALALAGQTQQSGPDESDFSKVQQKKWNEFYAQEAATYDIRLGRNRIHQLEVKVEPVLYWSNPVRGGETNGAVFVWTYEGRAEMVGTVFSYLARDDPKLKYIAHSFQSLSLEPLAARRAGADAWSISQPGIQPHPIPGAPPPAATSTLRLSQMRDLAREFSATTMLEDVEQELRLLSQPIHRNTQTRNAQSVGDVLDGALFTFVTGTDPELMLVIEARTDDDKPTWHYAAGRFTDLTLKLRHKQVVLWTHERGSRLQGRDDPYISGRTGVKPRVIE